MATTIDEIEVLIKANAASFESELKAVKRELKQFETASKTASKATKSISAGMMVVGTAVGQVIGAAVSKAFQSMNQHMGEAVSRLDTLNNYSRVMSNLGISAQDADKSLKVLDESILGLPTKLDDAANAVQRLTATNGNIAASTDMFLALNNAILAGGASADIQSTAMEQMMQAYSKGRPDAMEWRAFLTAMPAQLKQVATAMGYSSTALGGDFQTALVDGKISMNDFMVAVMKLNKEGVAGFKSFSEQARNATGGVQTGMINLGTAITRGIANVMNVIGQSNITAFFNTLAKAVDTAFVYVAAFVKTLKEAVAWVSALFGGSGSTNSIVQETSKATDNMDGIAAGAGNAANGLDDASKSAKNLKKQLAGFDEMNVLTEQKDSGSSTNGAGAGGATIADYKWDSSGMEGATDKIEKAVERIKKLFKDLFGDLDLQKIVNSFKQFGKDLDKFLTPAKKILGDLWNTYLKPFIGWAGNDLLPAFLNALGGAIALLGKVLGNVWDTFLKPFIDLFLVPIAKFTGGVIVSVLNGIGDALRGISENSAAVETLSLIVKSLLTLAGINLAAGFATGVINALTGGALAFNGFLGVLSKTTGGFDLFNKAGAAGSGIINGVKSAASGVVGHISALGAPLANLANGFTGASAGSGMFISSLGAGIIVMEAVVAAILAVQTAMEFFKLKTMEAELAELQYKSTEEAMKETTDWHNESIQRQIDLKNELEGITKNLADAQLALLDAQDAAAASQSNADAIARQYGMTTEQAREYVAGLDLASGNLTEKDKKLAEAVYDLDSKQGRLKEAVDKVTESKNKQTTVTEELEKQQWKEVMSQQKAEAEALLAAGKYDELRKKIINLKNSNGEYTLENGQKCKINKDNMQSMAEFIGGQLATIDDDNGKAWKSVWNSADRTVDNLNNDTAKKLASGGKSAGANWAEGIGKGAESKQGWLGTTISNIAGSMLKIFKGEFKIFSPSRVMAQMGVYIMEGMNNGLESKTSSTLSTVRGIGDDMKKEFGNISSDIPSVLSNLSKTDLAGIMESPSINGNLTHKISDEIELREQPIVLSATLQIDGQDVPVSLNFAQHIADSINDLSALRNRSVITV